MNLRELESVASAMTAPGKGILAADESSGTIKKRFDAIGVESTEDTRRAYRETAVHDAGPRRVHQRRDPLRRDDAPADRRRDAVRRGAAAAGHRPGDQGRQGRQGAGAAIPARRSPRASTACASGWPSTASSGARFAKWRAVITIGDGIPTPFVHRGQRPRPGALRRAVPGGRAGARSSSPRCSWTATTPSSRCEEVTAWSLSAVFDQLYQAPCPPRGDAAQAQHGPLGQGLPAAGECRGGRRGHGALLPRTCPPPCPASCSSPAARARPGHGPPQRHQPDRATPWQLSFCFGRALQQTVLATWGGQSANAAKAQEALLHRAHLNGLARRGTYESGLEKSGVPVTQA